MINQHLHLQATLKQVNSLATQVSVFVAFFFSWGYWYNAGFFTYKKLNGCFQL